MRVFTLRCSTEYIMKPEDIMTKIRRNNEKPLKRRPIFGLLFWTAAAAVGLIILCLPENRGHQHVVVMKMVLSAQGKDRCPEADATPTDGPKVVLKARSRLDCARMCASREGCLHNAFNKNDKTCTHYYSTPAKLVPEKDCNFMMKEAAFEGCFAKATVRKDPDGCSLPFQYENKQYNQCLNVSQNMTTPQCVTSRGQLRDCITPPGFVVQQQVANLSIGTSTPMPCMGNWIVIMQRHNGSVSFDARNWTDYKNGFGDFGGSDFWIGNDNIHAITNKSGVNYRLRVEVQTYKSGYWYYAEYETFRIDSEDDGYAIHLSGYSGNAGDSLSNTTIDPALNHNGMKFSTLDVDNDMGDGVPTCSVYYQGAWWFNDCSYSCLTCPNNTARFSWFTLNDSGVQPRGRLRGARMLISRIGN